MMKSNYFEIHVAIKQIEYNTLIFSDILPNDDIESLLKPISHWLTFFEITSHLNLILTTLILAIMI